MSDFQNYQLKKSRHEAARNDWERASVKMDLTGIKMRLAEIKSQYQPLAGLLDKRMTERERLYAAAYYVVVGREYKPVEADHE
jgi:hypothetical protein